MKKFEGQKCYMFDWGGAARVCKNSARALLLASFIALSFNFFSCSNFSGDSTAALALLAAAGGQGGQSSPQPALSDKSTIIFTGTLGANGAAPNEILKQVQDDAAGGVSKSAKPVTSGTNFVNFARAEVRDEGGAVIDTATGTFGTGASANKFTIPLALGKTWKIYCGVKDTNGTPDDESDDIEVYVDFFEKDVTLDDPTLTHIFYPKPLTTGSGTMALEITLAGNVVDLQAAWLDDELAAACAITVTPVAPGNGTKTISASNIPCGSYALSIVFLDSSGAELYSTAQRINIFAGLVTDKWVSDAGDGSDGISGGAFTADDSLVQNRLDTTLYVGNVASASIANNPITKTASNDNSGSLFAPLATVQKAVDKIAAYGNGSPYKICVSGTLPQGSLDIPDTLNVKAGSLKICGLDLLDDGTPVSAIDAGGSGTALTVSTSVPVTLENIKITGGNNAGGNGGGIYVASGANVTLKAGAVVAGNQAFKGGGVYVDGNFTLDGGVIGDESKEEHATWEHYSNRATGSDNVGGGIFYSATGKVAIKSGTVAYNFAYRGGGIGSRNGSYNANSQLAIEGGKIRHNCSTGDNGGYKCYSYGGGVFVNGSKLSFTGGEIYGNYGSDGGGGLFLEQTSDAVMSGGSVHDNEYNNATGAWKNGADIVVFDSATLSMTGGRVYSSLANDYCVNVMTSTCSLKMSGSATIEKSAPVWLGRYEDGAVTQRTQITIAGALTPPDPANLSKKNAYIVPAEWKRGLQVLNASGPTEDAKKALVAANIGRFGTVDDDFEVKAKGTTGIINAPICVAAPNGTRRSPVDEGALGQKVWGPPNATDTARGTRSQPFAKMSQAVAQMTDKTVPYEILVNGTIKGDVFACAEFDGAKVGDVTIRGVNGDNSNDVLDADKLDATSDRKYPVLAFRGTTGAKISATIQDLKITGGNYLDSTSGSPSGGGISASYTDISLAKGALIAGNQARQGGGLYIKQGNLFVYADARVGEDGDETAGWNMAAGQCSNSANDCGGGIYCDTGGVYLGYKDLLTVATGADKWTGGVYRNHASYDGGGIYVVDGECRLAEGNVSRNSCSGDGGGIYAAEGVLSVTGGKICGNKTTTQNGGGVFIGFSEFSMSGGEICDNEACLLGGGVCIGATNLDTSKFSLTGGEICGNKAADGGGIYGKNNVEVSLSGGKIANNAHGAVHTLSEKFTMGGSVWIPYGVTDGDTTVTGVGKNDVILDENRYITIESALSLPTGASGANATITPSSWKRGTVIAKGKNSGALPSGSENRLALADASGDGWAVELSSDKKSATIDAPIYVAAGAAYDAATNPGGYRACGSGGDNSKIGTKSAPYATVTKALGDLNNSGKHYTIYIDGTVSENLMISSRSDAFPNVTGANSITLKGAATTLATPISITEATADCLNGGGTGRVITMLGPVPVITNSLKISGGKYGDEGGGIYIAYDADLTLDNNTFVTGNSVYYDGGLSLIGGGISVNGALKIKGTVKVHDNKKLDGSDNVIGDSNVYLPSENVMEVLGDLTGSEIHVTTGVKPSIDYTQTPPAVNTVTITSNYSHANSDHPSKFFTSDQNYGFASWNGDDEAEFGVHGGGISVEDFYKDLALSLDKTWETKAKLADGSARFIVKGTIDGHDVNFITPTSDYYASISLKLLYHGEEIPQTSSYYSVTNCYLYPKSGLPAGDYVIAATVVYKGKTYSASFEIKVIGDSVSNGYVMTGGETVTGAVGTNARSEVFITGRTVDIPVIIACSHEIAQGEYEKYCSYGTNRPYDAKGKGENYPAYYVSWYDALVYCNLRSIVEGLTPVYSVGGKTDPNQWTGIVAGTGDELGKYRGPDSSSSTWNAVAFDQSANGWRLPTEAEWEYLARAANTKDYYYSGTTDKTTNGRQAYVVCSTSQMLEVGEKATNAIGLRNMSGNVAEWCWDWNVDPINATTPATGPDTGSAKVYRGGAFNYQEIKCSVKDRSMSGEPNGRFVNVGFRVVRNAR